MTKTAELQGTKSQLIKKLNVAKAELRNTSRKLCQARTNENKMINDWKRTTESLKDWFDFQKREIENLESTVNCFLCERTDLTSLMVFDVKTWLRGRKWERFKKKLDYFSLKLEQYRNICRIAEKHSQDRDEVASVNIDKDEQVAKSEWIKIGEFTNKNCSINGHSLGPIEERLLQETQAELETTTEEVMETKSELASEYVKLRETVEKLKQFQLKLDDVRHEKKFLESKLSPRYYLPFLKPTVGSPVVIHDHRKSEGNLGRNVFWYRGAKVWKCPIYDVVKTMKKVLLQKNKDIYNLRLKQSQKLSIIKKTLQNEHAQKVKTIDFNLNLTLNEITIKYNRCIADISNISHENMLLRGELMKLQNLSKITSANSRTIRTEKIIISSSEIDLPIDKRLEKPIVCQIGNNKPEVRLKSRSVSRIGSQIFRYERVPLTNGTVGSHIIPHKDSKYLNRKSYVH